MLVLTRRRSESLVINEDVVVTVLKIQGNRVTIGIEAPGNVPVHRKEIYERTRREPLARITQPAPR